jgi:hypothetical protein
VKVANDRSDPALSHTRDTGDLATRIASEERKAGCLKIYVDTATCEQPRAEYFGVGRLSGLLAASRGAKHRPVPFRG